MIAALFWTFRGNRIRPDLGLVCLKLYDDDDTLGYDEIRCLILDMRSLGIGLLFGIALFDCTHCYCTNENDRRC